TYLQTIPGVVSLGDRGGQLFIRGGTPSQNLVLLDGVLIYQPLHILGFFSAFPEDLISFVDVYAGGYGARYSGRISSVIDVSTRDGNRQFFEGSGSISPFLSSFLIEGPLRKGHISMLASIRRSTIERLSPALYGRSLPFQFGDLFVKIQRTDGISSKCSASFMSTYDRGRIEAEGEHSEDVFQWNNVVIGARCLVFPTSAPYLFEVVTGLSYVDSDAGNEIQPERSSDALQVGFDMHLKRVIGRAQLNIGSFVRMTWLGLQLREQFQNIGPREDLLFSLGAYAETVFSPSEYLTITPGLSLVLHPEDYPISIEPRLRAVWKPGGKDGADEISGAIGLYRQTLVGVIDERDAGSAFIAWMTAPVKTTQSKAVHGLIGWQRPLGRQLRFATEAYYKRMSDLPVPTWSSVASFTTTLGLASGESYGFDGRLEVFGKNFYGYVGYGYSETLYWASEGSFGSWYGESVQEYHPPHDRRHQLNVVLSLELGRFTANARWQYGSGLPFTRPYGFDELISLRDFADVRRSLGTTRLLYDKPYRARLPVYHRLDLSIERVFELGEGSLAFQLGAINVYDRANLFYFDLFTIRRVDQLPFLPTLSIKYRSNR
ncbi:MAG: Plug domain-containing protein, partial [Bacteroidetes bacterium]|nr:Plug domain-containing protein [Bacteroidota bacterium]